VVGPAAETAPRYAVVPSSPAETTSHPCDGQALAVAAGSATTVAAATTPTTAPLTTLPTLMSRSSPARSRVLESEARH
jgi:hypothetical protein